MRNHRNRASAMALAATVALFSAGAVMAEEGVQIMRHDAAPTAGDTGVRSLQYKAQAVQAQNSASDIDQGEGDRGGSGNDPNAGGNSGNVLVAHDTATSGGAGWLCEILSNSPVAQFVEVSMLCK